MKVLLWGDIQVYPYAEWSKPTGTGRTALLDICEKTFKWVCEVIDQEKIDHNIFLGDLFQTTDQVDVPSLQLATRWMREIGDLATGTAILGNHDIYSKDARINSLAFLERDWDLIDEPQDAGNFLFIPYVPEDIIRAYLKAHQERLIFGHFDVKGAPLRPGVFEKNGIELNTHPAFIAHYHHPAVHDSTWFVGAPFHRNFSDMENDLPRGATILEFDDSGSLVEFKRIENPHTLFFRTLHLERYKTTAKRLAALENFVDKHPRPQLTFLRIICPTGDEEVCRSYTGDFRHVRTIPVQPGAVEITQSLPVIELSPEKILTQQVLKDKETGLPKKGLLSTGRAILSEVQDD